LFVVLKDGSLKNVILKDYLYIPSLMEYLFSWSILKSLNQYYVEDHRDMLVTKIAIDKVMLCARDCPCTHLFNFPTRSLEAHIIYTFRHNALGDLIHNPRKYVPVFSDSDPLQSKPKNFDYESYLQSKSIQKVLKTLQDHVKSKFDVIYSDVHGPFAIPSLGGQRYFVQFIYKFS
jgi:hypothetical protein